ncbi:CoA-transferase [Streptomyces halstedii]|uniref:CoA-transferase n=1 Tax=Streptomyces halstedii TaxID=1944 RepID=UPI0036813871
MRWLRHTDDAAADALEGLSDGSMVAIGGCCDGAVVPERSLRALAGITATRLRLLCPAVALDVPAVQEVVLNGSIELITRACHEPSADTYCWTRTGKRVQSEWLTYEEMTEGLTAGTSDLHDFYSSGELHTHIRRPLPAEGRRERLMFGGESFVRKAALRPDVTLLRAAATDSAGNLRLLPGDADVFRLSAAMATAAIRTVVECETPPVRRLAGHEVDVPGQHVAIVLTGSSP